MVKGRQYNKQELSMPMHAMPQSQISTLDLDSNKNDRSMFPESQRLTRQHSTDQYPT